MKLYFLRHAEAIPLQGANFGSDSERPLTEEGVKRMKQVAPAMRRMKLSFDLILSSPFERAKRTAEFVAIEFKALDKLHYSQHLTTGGEPDALIAELLKTYASAESILLVGHEPNMSRLMSMLLTGNLDLVIHFRKAALAELAIENLTFGRCAVLEWLLTPRQLSKMAD
jgi:phosphohistidine phosphatase